MQTLEHILRTAFNQRRKTLRNSLKGEISEQQLTALAINPAARPETLSLEQFVAISNAIREDT
nr:rRNA adenine N-6-methyltransferase family protein [Oceanicoccus sagamiensis]